ncbi:E3 ubiquitin-protein ligase BOI-like [Bidens hawaiensis]|uniref:E3 ubiquitin-protein ligase BOI-like n=1 Tax=Bidens hawaiensis TaxID=980011 RepID=UPI00404AD90C
MAVQAQLYSDHYQNINNININNNNIPFSNLPQDCVFSSVSSVFGFGDENNQNHQDQSFIMNSGSGYQSNQLSSSNSRFGMMNNGFQDLASELEKQRMEMDCFLHFQNEKLKAVLNEESRNREVMMQGYYESKMRPLIDAKDEVLNAAKMRRNELQNYLLMAEQEVDNWERKAMETEVMVTELNTKVKQAKARRHEDAESICNNGGENENGNVKKMVCKVCHVRSTCMLLLPCRHLCCCRGCEGLVMFCPVCEAVKNGSLEVFLGLNGGG